MDDGDDDRFLAAIDARGRWLRVMRALLVEAVEALGRLPASPHPEGTEPLSARIASALDELDRIRVRLAARSARRREIYPKRRKISGLSPPGNPDQLWLIAPEEPPPDG